jgi:hypothetical protein
MNFVEAKWFSMKNSPEQLKSKLDSYNQQLQAVQQKIDALLPSDGWTAEQKLQQQYEKLKIQRDQIQQQLSSSPAPAAPRDVASDIQNRLNGLPETQRLWQAQEGLAGAQKDYNSAVAEYKSNPTPEVFQRAKAAEQRLKTYQEFLKQKPAPTAAPAPVPAPTAAPTPKEKPFLISPASQAKLDSMEPDARIALIKSDYAKAMDAAKQEWSRGNERGALQYEKRMQVLKELINKYSTPAATPEPVVPETSPEASVPEVPAEVPAIEPKQADDSTAPFAPPSTPEAPALTGGDDSTGPMQPPSTPNRASAPPVKKLSELEQMVQGKTISKEEAGQLMNEALKSKQHLEKRVREHEKLSDTDPLPKRYMENENARFEKLIALLNNAMLGV